jgi:integrase/recombinase XerD
LKRIKQHIGGRPTGSGVPSRSLNEKEVKRLRAVIASSKNAERNSALIELALGTGCRINELVQLKLGDVTSRGKVKREFVLGKTKNGTSHRVHLSDRAHRALTMYLAERDLTKITKSEPLFPSQKRGFLSPNSGSRLVVTLLDQAGIEKAGGAHALRKTFADALLRQSGGNLKLVQRCLNHKNLSTTSLYLSASSHEISEAVSALRI